MDHFMQNCSFSRRDHVWLVEWFTKITSLNEYSSCIAFFSPVGRMLQVMLWYPGKGLLNSTVWIQLDVPVSAFRQCHPDTETQLNTNFVTLLIPGLPPLHLGTAQGFRSSGPQESLSGLLTPQEWLFISTHICRAADDADHGRVRCGAHVNTETLETNTSWARTPSVPESVLALQNPFPHSNHVTSPKARQSEESGFLWKTRRNGAYWGSGGRMEEMGRDVA